MDVYLFDRIHTLLTHIAILSDALDLNTPTFSYLVLADFHFSFLFCSSFFINCIFWLKAKLHVSIYCCVNISMKSYPCVYLGPIFQRIHEHHNPNLVKFHIALAGKMMIRSGHNVAHATTAQLLWHVQNCDLIASLELQLMQRLISLYFIYELCFHNVLIMGS